MTWIDIIDIGDDRFVFFLQIYLMQLSENGRYESSKYRKKRFFVLQLNYLEYGYDTNTSPVLPVSVICYL